MGILYITDMISIDLDPDFPTAEELGACAKRARKGTALWMWNDDYFENVLLWIWAEAKKEVMRNRSLDAPVPRYDQLKRKIEQRSQQSRRPRKNRRLCLTFPQMMCSDIVRAVEPARKAWERPGPTKQA